MNVSDIYNSVIICGHFECIAGAFSSSIYWVRVVPNHVPSFFSGEFPSIPVGIGISRPTSQWRLPLCLFDFAFWWWPTSVGPSIVCLRITCQQTMIHPHRPTYLHLQTKASSVVMYVQSVVKVSGAQNTWKDISPPTREADHGCVNTVEADSPEST